MQENRVQQDINLQVDMKYKNVIVLGIRDIKYNRDL